ncbi:MAG TPA: HRDC domain-containing protein [bacterium]|uniref:Ribonuclease D n=1 Tax=candidate division TA06 bacterium ADurb.Bin417 TaxID=1852828 RepID=A0A1V5MEN1_UNCT6|nr:MAG: Ribonuclease D [candidate division TA06 bacterium ADurb.Bin417]HNQ35259.1 HRDC domain-containing protein [bacterium]HNS48278.1 HRDC domain-containing protein [bacterium]
MPDLPGKMKYQMVETHEELKKAAQVLAGARSIALDLEGDSMFHYGDTLCLAQVSDGSRTWLIDPLKIKDLSPLSAILGNTGVEKILHGSDYDIRLIRGRLGINCPPIFDTELAARFLGMARSGLADVLAKRFGVSLDKKFQKDDWSQRPLPDEMLAYAAADVHWLIRLAEMMKEDLKRLGRLDWVEEECDLLARAPDRRRENGPLHLRFRGAAVMDRRSLAILEAILQMRESLAQERDRPPFKVLDPDAIRQIIQQRPETDQALLRIKGLGRRSEKFRAAVLSAVRSGLELPESRLPVYPKGERRRSGKSNWSPLSVQNLKEWRNRRAAALGLDCSLVCTTSMIQALAARRPLTPEALDQVEGLRNWQKREFGAEICVVLRRGCPKK